MTTEVIEQGKLEAICRGCRQTLAFDRSNLNQKFVCKSCGFSSFLSSDMVLTKTSVFTKNVVKEVEKQEEKQDEPKCLFRYFRHGSDAPQAGIILKLTTTDVKFTTKTKLNMGSKITFHLKDKKFIVNIRHSESNISTTKDGSIVTQYVVTADYEIILTGEIKEKVHNPHYLIKQS